MRRRAKYPTAIDEGYGLTLRPWDRDLVAQMAAWREYGFPYHAFDLGMLRDPRKANAELASRREESVHRHFIACEGDVAVGRTSVNLEDSEGIYLWAVHVPPEHEGRGVARRMLATLMTWLEQEYPGRDFTLTTNTFAEHAHRAYFALGFEISESRWHYDREVATALWSVSPEEREQLARHIRFHSGRWEVRAYLMRRRRGAPMRV